MFNIHKAQFIPQANVQSKAPELSDLVTVKADKKIEWDLMFTPDKNKWRIKPQFYAEQTKEQGFTAALQDGFLFLIQADENQIAELRPKFLKGDNTGGTFTSNYFNLLVVQAGFSIDEKCYLFLTEQETGIEGVKAYIATKDLPDISLDKEESLIIEAPITTSSVTVENNSNVKDWADNNQELF